MPESEWGKLNAGQSYGILAVDVDRALACADLGKYEQIVMQAVRERSWGIGTRRKAKGVPWPDPMPAQVDLAALAREMGATFQRLYEARDNLVASRMIILRDDKVMPNKNAHEWINPRSGKPRLAPGQIAYAARATTRRRPPEPEVHSRPSVNAPGSAFTPQREVHSRPSVNGNIVRARVPEDSEDFRIPEDVCETGNGTHTHGPDEIGSTPQRPAEDQALVAEAARVLAGQLATQHLGTELLRCQNLPDLAALEGWRWILAANRIQSSAVTEAKRRSWHYLVAVARNLTEADRFASSAGVGPHVNGHAAAPMLSKAEIRMRENREGLRKLAEEFKSPTPQGGDG